jgi:TrmH family RNA methyltransferase
MLSGKEIKYCSSLKLRKYRDREKKFLIEGFHLLEECLMSPYSIEIVIIRTDLDRMKYSGLISELRQKKVRIENVSGKVLEKISDTRNSQGIVAVVRQLSGNCRKSSSFDNSSQLVLALDGISDPGNLGTILRNAYWFSIKNVFIGTGSVDIFNPKVIRSSQGAFFHVNLVIGVELVTELRHLQSIGYSILVFTPGAGVPLSELKLSGKCIMVFGSESKGISVQLLEMGFEKINIDRYSECESLNLAVASGIAMYQFRQLFRSDLKNS